eukprot:40059_1
MSLFKKLIGQKKKKPTKKDETKKVNDAIIKLRAHITLLTKRKTHSEKQIASYNKAAQQCLKKKDRKGALVKIKLRKQVEKRLETIENQIFNLELQIMTLDETLMNRSMVDAMTVARDAMTVENPDDMMDQVEDLQEGIAEAIEIQNEFNKLMGTPLIDYDEDELEQELAELDQLDAMDLNLDLNVNKNKKQHTVHQKKIEQKQDDEEEEVEEEDPIKELREMEMNLSANDKHMIDVQIVQTSPQMALASC